MTTLRNIKEGDTIGKIELDPVSRMDLIKYSGASGDFNPIHTIDEAAEEVGLPGIIAHGMWTMGNLAKVFSPYLEEGYIQDYSIRFVHMVFLHDIITLKARYLEEFDKNILLFYVTAENQKGSVVMEGEVKFRLVVRGC